jgi:hypothetical protein
MSYEKNIKNRKKRLDILTVFGYNIPTFGVMVGNEP